MSFGTSGGGGQTSTSRPATGAERTDVYNSGINAIRQTLGYGPVNQAKIGSGDVQLPFTNYKGASLQPYAQYQTPSYTDLPQYNAPTDYVAPTPERFGSYEDLYNAILQSRTAPLSQYEQKQREALNQDLSNRGIWSSGIAGQLGTDITDTMADQYRQAAGEAATQRYGLEAQEKESLNQLATQNAQYANQSAMENALRTLQAGQTSGMAQNTWNLQDALNLSNSQYQNTNAANTLQMEEAQRKYQSMWEPLNYLLGLYNTTGGAFSNSSGSNPSGFQFSI